MQSKRKCKTCGRVLTVSEVVVFTDARDFSKTKKAVAWVCIKHGLVELIGYIQNEDDKKGE